MLLQHLEHSLAGHAEHVELGVQIELGGTGDLLHAGLGDDHAVGLVDDHVVAVGIAHELAGQGVHEERGHGVLDDEVGLVEVVLHDMVGHGQGEGGVGAGLHGHELVGIAGRGVEQKAHIDDLGAVALGLDHVLGEAVLVLHRVRAPHDHVIGAVDVARVGVVVTVGVAQIVVRGEQGAVVQAVGLHRERGAVKATEAGVQHAGQAHGGRVARREVPECQRLRAVLLALLVQLGRNLVERLIPADLLPLALAALTGALEGGGQAILVVDLATRHNALLADVRLAHFRARVLSGLGADDLPVLDDRLKRAILVVTPPGARRVHEALFRHQGLLSSCSLVSAP